MFHFWRWLWGDNSVKEVSVNELYEAATDVRLRKLAFDVCVNMIASAVGRCEFRTFENSVENKRCGEYYLWNIEPNINQNSTEFLHKLIYKLYSINEALVIEARHPNGKKYLVVADDFNTGKSYATKMTEYTGVRVGETTYSKTFRENEVLHFKLHNTKVKELMASIHDSYEKLIAVSEKAYARDSGVHLKVKVDQIVSGEQNFEADFKRVIDDNVKPWITQENGALPQFEGYEYTDMSKGVSDQAAANIRSLYDDIFAYTARCLQIPPVLLTGDVAGTADAMSRWLTVCIDPLCDMIQEEINRKRYGAEDWVKGNYLQIDTSSIVHFDLFANASNIEKLIGSGCFSINDVLASAGQPTIAADWADKHWLTFNIGTIDSAARAVDDLQKGG